MALQVSQVNALSHSGLITLPGTSPITYVVKKFAVSGQVFYHVLNSFNRPRPVSAAGAQVTIREFNKDNVYKTFTDSFGRFNIQIPEGKYTVTVSDVFGTRFFPFSRTIMVKGQDSPAVNFRGMRPSV